MMRLDAAAVSTLVVRIVVIAKTKKAVPSSTARGIMFTNAQEEYNRNNIASQYIEQVTTNVRN